MSSKKTGMRSSVKFCKSKASVRSIGFFKYPNPNERLVTWINNFKIKNMTEAFNKKNSNTVCREHFKDRMFLNASAKN